MRTTYRSPAAVRLVALPAAVVALTLGVWSAAAAQDGADENSTRPPLVLKAQGSFFVGGHSKHTDALTSLAPSPGTITVDQMYVQYKIPYRPHEKPKTPVVMIHGCCLSGKSWEETPDGRMGWDEYFVRRGHAVYIPDQVARARSGFDATIVNEVRLGLNGKKPSDLPGIFTIGHEGAWTGFRFGPTVGTPYPDAQFPVEAVDEFYKQVIPDLNGFLAPFPPWDHHIPTYDNLSRLAIRLRGAVLMGHSESGFFPENAALVSTRGIKGMISIEPGGSCTTTNPNTLPLTPQQIRTLAKIPTLVIFGDHLNGNWVSSLRNCRQYAAAITAAGGDITVVHLPERGIHGNSHMMMLDRNNLQVANLILRWIDRHVEQSALASR